MMCRTHIVGDRSPAAYAEQRLERNATGGEMSTTAMRGQCSALLLHLVAFATARH